MKALASGEHPRMGNSDLGGVRAAHSVETRRAATLTHAPCALRLAVIRSCCALRERPVGRRSAAAVPSAGGSEVGVDTRDEEEHGTRAARPGDVAAVVAAADVPLDRDAFLRSLLRRLAGTLEDLVGVEEASGFVSVVGDEIGHVLDGAYKVALDSDRFDRQQVAAVLVDLKRRIEGDFFVLSQDEDRIVLGNRACPFGDQVLGRPSLCMMTSNVFGSITATNLGYAHVELQETIAEGAPGCRVVVDLRPPPVPAPGREYFAYDGLTARAEATLEEPSAHDDGVDDDPTAEVARGDAHA